MPLARRRFLALAATAAALLGLPHPASAQSYPARPVRLVTGYTPAGATDIFARLIAQWLTERLGQPFVVDNRPGAASNIAVEAVVRSPADGYTLFLVAPANAINATLYDRSRSSSPTRRPIRARSISPRPDPAASSTSPASCSR